MRKVLIILVLIIGHKINAQVERIEPPFWWTEMKMSEIQLLIYGDNIAQLIPKLVESKILVRSIIRAQ